MSGGDLDDFLDGTDNFDTAEEGSIEDTTIKELNKLYQHGASYVRNNAGEINKDVLLYLYARFKYITEGPCNVPRPGGLLNFEAKAKWDSWSALNKEAGFNKEIAREQYIAKLDALSATNEWRNGFVAGVAAPKGKFDTAEQKGTFGVRISIHEKMADLDQIHKNCFDMCKDGCLDELKEYFAQIDKNYVEPMLNQQDENKMTLLMWACDIGHLDIVKYLTETGANLNMQDADGQTCLHYAVSCDNVDIVKYLAGNKKLNRSIVDNENLKAVNLTTSKEIIALLS